MDEDSALLQRYAREGSETAFEELVRRRLGLVYGTALRRLRDPHRAQEVAQTVFSDLARKASALGEHPALVSWLYTSTHYATATLLRTEHRQRSRDYDAHFMNSINAPDAAEDWGNLRPLLDDELNRLGGRFREAILLRFFHGESFAGVGRALRLSEEAARKRVERGLEHLRLRLERRGITSTALVLSALLTEQGAFAAPESLAGLVAKTALLKGAAAASALGPLSFMTTSKAAIGVGAALLLAGWGGVAVQASRAQAAESERAGLESRAAAEEAQLSALEARVSAAASAGGTAAAGRSQRGAGAAGVGRTTSPAGSGGTRAAAQARGAAFMAQHPGVRAALVNQFDATHLAQYGPFYSSLGLSPDKVQAMQALLRLGNSFGRVVQGGSIELSVADVSPGAFQDQQASLQALLGEAGYQQFQAYQQTVPARMTTSSLAGLLVDSDSPLSADQAQQMVAVFAGATDQTNHTQYNWTAVYAAAAGILTPAQLQMLQNLGTRTQGWQQVVEAAH